MKASPDPHCRQLLTASRINAEGLASPVRDDLCLLQGLLLCGVCGRRLGVRYTNRLIAATLETRWNDALQRLHDLEAELAAFERKTMRAVTAEQKRQILRPPRRAIASAFCVCSCATSPWSRVQSRNSSDCRSAGKAARPRSCGSRCRRTGPTPYATPKHRRSPSRAGGRPS